MRQPLSALFGVLGTASAVLTWAGCESSFSAQPREQPAAARQPSPGSTFESSHVIYVADSAQKLRGPRRVAEFATKARGDVPPLRTIEGPQTRLEGPTFVALDGKGTLYVVNYNFLQPKIVPVIAVFAPEASGDAPPIRKIWLSSMQ